MSDIGKDFDVNINIVFLKFQRNGYTFRLLAKSKIENKRNTEGKQKKHPGKP